MALTYPSSVYYEEVEGSGDCQLHDGRLEGTRIFQTAWSDRFNFTDNIYHPQTPFNPGTGGMQYMSSPSGTGLAMLADGFHIAGFNANPVSQTNASEAGTYQYETARITVPYRSFISLLPSYPIIGGITFPKLQAGTLLDYSIQPGNEFQSIPGRYLVYSTGSPTNDKVEGDRSLGVLSTSDDFILTWYRASAPQWSILTATKGCVNYADFLGYGPGKVMFLNYTQKELILSNGDLLWNVTMHFKVRSIPQPATLSSGDPSGLVTVGWNYAYRINQDSAPWKPVFNCKSDGTQGDPPFTLADFNPLFQYAAS